MLTNRLSMIVAIGVGLLAAPAAVFGLEHAACGDRNLPIRQAYPPGAFQHAGRGGRVLDVTKPPFNATGDGTTDDTQALRAAMRFVAESYEPLVGEGWAYCGCKLNQSWIIYLPDGEYLVRDTIDQGWPVRGWHPRDGWSAIRRTTLASPEAMQSRRGEGWAAENFHIRIVGQSREKTVIRLADECPGFGAGAAKSVVAFHQGLWSNVSQGNFCENLTIVTGRGNPGAVALRWNAANWGGVRNVLLQSGDGRGRAGLLMDVPFVEGYLRDITVEGFDAGIELDVANGANVAVLEHVTLKGQAAVGLRVGKHHACLDAQKLSFENVPVAVQVDAGAQAVLLDSRASGLAGAAAALVAAEHGHLFVSGFSCTGFASVTAGPVTEIPAASLTINARDMPPLVPEPDLSRWADVQAYGAVGDGLTDDTAAIQRAMESGKPIVFLPGVAYVVNGTVTIPASVREICFLHGSVYRTTLGIDAAMFRVAEPSAEPLWIHQNVSAGGTFVDHEADRPLVLEDVFSWFHHTRDYARNSDMQFPGPAAQTADLWQLYRNTRPDGRAKEVYAANVMGFAVGGQGARHAVENVHAWVRQLDNEHIPYAQVAVRRSDLWLLGFKTENAEVLFHAEDGSRLEWLGGINHTLGPRDKGAMIVSRDSDVTAVFVVWAGGGKNQPDVLESIRGSATTRVPLSRFPPIDGQGSSDGDTRTGTFSVSIFSGR